MRAPDRAAAREMMDAEEVDPAQLARSLADLRTVNRWLGGIRVALHALAPLLRDVRGEASVLDVATGSGDIPIALARWARANGISVRVLATDNHPVTLAQARQHAAMEPRICIASADALELPYDDGAFHIAMCHTALHHFRPDAAVRLLSELNRVATVGVAVTDLERSRIGIVVANALAATVWRRHPITRHDGPVSARAAYTAAEVRCMAAAAGMQNIEIRTSFFANRLALVSRRSREPGP